MLLAPEKIRITQDEFLRMLELPENQDRQLELWDGEIIETMPKRLHAKRANLLNALFFNYLVRNPIGQTYSELQIVLEGEDYAPQPDVCFVTTERDDLDSNDFLRVIPDLVVEIQSPDQSDRFMREKGDWYIAHGCRMVIIVYLKPIVEVQTPTERKLLTIDDTLDGGDVLPGFSVAVATLYPSQT